MSNGRFDIVRGPFSSSLVQELHIQSSSPTLEVRTTYSKVPVPEKHNVDAFMYRHELLCHGDGEDAGHDCCAGGVEYGSAAVAEGESKSCFLSCFWDDRDADLDSYPACHIRK